PTGSAVVADLVDVVRALTSDPENRVPHLAFQPGALSDIPILSMDDVLTAYYLRIHVQDRPGVLADVTQIFADHAISIEAIIQKEPQANIASVPIVILTHEVSEQNMNQAIAEVENLEAVTSKIMRIRLETLS
ncbi:MAG: ACT domain-containing protein, partial [Gammaproteobacteria bacterium]